MENFDENQFATFWLNWKIWRELSPSPFFDLAPFDDSMDASHFKLFIKTLMPYLDLDLIFILKWWVCFISWSIYIHERGRTNDLKQ